MTCHRCEQPQDWGGDHRRCAFENPNEWSPENWNCGTMNALRAYGYEGGWDFSDNGVVYSDYHGDQSYMHVPLVSYSDSPIEDQDAVALWLTWYKRRGTVEQAWILSYVGAPRRPSLAEMDGILKHLEGLTS